MILILAAALRLGWPGNVKFNQDEVSQALITLDMVHGRHFPLLGMNSSVKIPNPPISIYLLAVPFALSDSPLVATGYVALLNVMAVVILDLISRPLYWAEAAAFRWLILAL